MGLSRPPRHPPLTPAKDVIPISIASQVSPAGASIAGAHGLGLISLSATSPGGFNALKATWEIYERKAMQNQQPIDRSQWSLAGPVHIADSRDQAFDDVRHGIDVWFNAFREEVSSGIVTNDWHTDPGQALVEMGMAVIGTVQDATEQLHRLQHQTGGFGTFLQVAHNWADWDQTRNSYELFARRVAPEFQRGNK
jgi:limonene 1,2-monooxygenase